MGLFYRFIQDQASPVLEGSPATHPSHRLNREPEMSTQDPGCVDEGK
jgi:hypothetical protein